MSLTMTSCMLGAILTILVCMFVFNCHVQAAPKPAKSSNLLTEGDIVVTPSLNELITATRDKRQRRSAAQEKIKLWENGLVPYTIDPNLHHKARKSIRKAVRAIERQTCIRFTPRENEEDYVEFVRGIGCFSPIGRQGGHQRISVGDGCEYKGLILHEIMHTIGFFHEHTRPDRDQHIMVLWWNIEAGKERNFETYSHDVRDTRGEEYDYRSIMHYSNKDYSYNGDNTIQSLQDPHKKLGQMEHLSKLDLQKISKVYKCADKKRGHCKDLSTICGYMATLGDYCRKYKILMAQFCKKSCNFCDWNKITSKSTHKSVFS